MPRGKKPLTNPNQSNIKIYLTRGEARRAKIEEENMATGQNSTAGGRDGSVHERDGVSSGMTSDISDAIKELTSSVTAFKAEIAGWQNEIKKWRESITIKVESIEKDMKDNIKPSLNSAGTWAASALDESKKNTGSINQIDARLSRLESNYESWNAKQDQNQNLKDREYKESNIRVLGIEEKDNENLKKLVLNLFQKVHPKLKLENIIHAFRIKKKDESDTRPRIVIIRFKEKKLRNIVFREARKKKEKLPDIKVTDDLTKQDIQLRNQANPQIKEAIEQGKKAFFTRGKLKIEGSFVEIRKQAIEQVNSDATNAVQVQGSG